MDLFSSMNTRLGGTMVAPPVEAPTPVTAPPLVTPPTVMQAQDDSVVEPSTFRERYDEKVLLESLQRLQKGTTFMLEHLYDERGNSKMADFLDLVVRVQQQATAFQAVRILSAP